MATKRKGYRKTPKRRSRAGEHYPTVILLYQPSRWVRSVVSPDAEVGLYEPDEDPAKIAAILEQGPHGVTGPPDG